MLNTLRAFRHFCEGVPGDDIRDSIERFIALGLLERDSQGDVKVTRLGHDTRQQAIAA